MSFTMNPRQINFVALCLVTLASLMAIFAFATGQESKRKLVREADAFTPIYQIAANDPQLTDLLAARRVHELDPRNSMRALQLSRLALTRYRSGGNTRYLGLARAALAPWWDSPEPALEIWLARGRILQSGHRFIEAARDLAALNQRHPRNIEALLLETDAWRRAGEIALAKRSCVRLAFSGRLDLAHYCGAEILLSSGEYQAAQALLASIIEDAANLSEGERAWAYAIYADSLVANANQRQARLVWQRILQSIDVPLAYRLAYADLLLNLQDWPAVVELLSQDRDTTAAMLRLAIAARNSDSVQYRQLRAQLAYRFAQVSDDSGLYLRDRAIHALSIMDDPATALDFAMQNWVLQKGWEDSALVLRLARIVDDSEALQRVERWQQTARGGESK